MRVVNKVMLTGRVIGKPMFINCPKRQTKISVCLVQKNHWIRRDQQTPAATTDLYRILLVDRLAEFALQKLQPGMHVYVEGRLQRKAVSNQDDEKVSQHEIIVQDMMLLDRPISASAMTAEPENERLSRSASSPDDCQMEA